MPEADRLPQTRAIGRSWSFGIAAVDKRGQPSGRACANSVARSRRGVGRLRNRAVLRSGCCCFFDLPQERIGHDVSAVVAAPRLDVVSGKAEAGEKVLRVKRSEFAFLACVTSRAPWRHFAFPCEFALQIYHGSLVLWLLTPSRMLPITPLGRCPRAERVGLRPRAQLTSVPCMFY